MRGVFALAITGKQQGMEGARSPLPSPRAGVNHWLWESRRLLWEAGAAAPGALLVASRERFLPVLLKRDLLLESVTIRPVRFLLGGGKEARGGIK